jgi:hypothetical protein
MTRGNTKGITKRRMHRIRDVKNVRLAIRPLDFLVCVQRGGLRHDEDHRASSGHFLSDLI